MPRRSFSCWRRQRRHSASRRSELSTTSGEIRACKWATRAGWAWRSMLWVLFQRESDCQCIQYVLTHFTCYLSHVATIYALGESKNKGPYAARNRRYQSQRSKSTASTSIWRWSCFVLRVSDIHELLLHSIIVLICSCWHEAHRVCR